MAAPDTLDAWLRHAEGQHAKAIDLGLERVQAVAARLGLVTGETRVPVFTVAGTNGKGSTCAMLEAILRAAGWRVGTYTSPHLVRFEERLRLDGAVVEGAALVPHFAAVEAARAATPLTYFEFTTLALLRMLQASALDAWVLEVGLGGRLDAVNVIDADCALITPVALDHQEFLGPDREAIGREKAGILRAGRPAVVADPAPPRSVVAHAEAIGADLRLAGRDFTWEALRAEDGRPAQWNWRGQRQQWRGLAMPVLRGRHQLGNAAGVLAALEAMAPRLPVSAQAVREGLARTELAGRFQIVPGQPTLVLDVGHNPHAMASLVANLDAMAYHPRTFAVFGMMADKDIDSVIAAVGTRVDHWLCADLPTPRAAPAAELAARVRAHVSARVPAGSATASAVPVETCTSPAAALAQAFELAGPADRIVVFGSFYTVGGVLAQPALRPGTVRAG